MKPSYLIKAIAAWISGALLVFTFAPFNWPVITFPVLAALLFFWHNASRKQAFALGFYFGLGFFGSTVSWVYISLHNFGQAPFWLAILLTILFIAYLALFPAFCGYLLARFFTKNILSKYLLAFPGLWVLTEWLRGWFLTGFPWVFIGYSQTQGFLKSFAPMVGVYGISWLIACLSGLLAAIFLMKKSWRSCFFMIVILMGIIGTSYFLSRVQWTQPISSPIPIALLQGNISQTVKWQAEQIPKTLAIYQNLINEAKTSQLIVLPEAALPLTQIQATHYLENLAKQARLQPRSLIIGIPVVENQSFYNGALALGETTAVYHKRHLVPFGEYMPLRFLLNWLNHYILIPMADFSVGAKKQPPFYVLNHVELAIYICYEIAYPELVRSDFPAAQAILVLSDDSWFGNSFASAQHLQIAQMRALETGRYAMVSTNDGLTAIIDPQGKITAIAPPKIRMVLSGEIRAMSGTTPWIAWGIHGVLWLNLILLGLAWLRQRRKSHE